ncbi:uncharacterized protein LOC119689526 [Teleopsis dalmanni]|uniref:uncharacterized protein LOC119689526 n=1 Tax=Teleopsis dalmanni TaxID=139649 RepID=UPI000D32BC2F|nr:uncharacterized protein LOC119689526 [Teleopsis dalmanni]
MSLKMPTVLLIFLLMIISLIQTVIGINCYSCESVYESESCGENFEPENYFKMDCSRVSPPRYMELELESRNSTACMKRVYKEHGVQKTVRSCFFGDVNDTAMGCRLDPMLTSVEEISCHVCDNENYCNRAKELHQHPAILAATLASFIFFAKILNTKSD